MNLLFLTFLFPLIGFLILAFTRDRMSENAAAWVGVGSLGLSFLSAIWVGAHFLLHPPAGGAYHQVLWQWINVSGLSANFGLRLDGLSLTMMGIITGVGFFIHLFAAWYMRGEEGYERFFSYMNLFIVAMLFLVLADNLLFLYFGWEGVGLCSYLLIGFFYKDPANGYAARKSFVITRVGDTFMAIGLFLLFRDLGTLNIQEALQLAPQHWGVDSTTVNLVALLLLGGAVGKSAQLPLQTWLPDAMAGPTPVSALIHAATMVTAGVYLIARTHTIFQMAPPVLELVGIIGAVTLLIACFCALVQTDIKRILAYSTMSQIGYMFLALGVSAWSSAIFHLMMHAFFKALLFLSAGAVINACHHEQDIFKMGGLRKKLPIAYYCFLAGGGALAALPLISAGFYSKDQILFEAFASNHGVLFTFGLLGAFLTPIYTFRLIFVAFHGKEQIQPHLHRDMSYWLPLIVLAILSTFVGAFIHPDVANVLPALPVPDSGSESEILSSISGGLAILGIVIAAWLYLGDRTLVTRIRENALAKAVRTWWFNAFGFDWLYDLLFVKPYMAIVAILRSDLVDLTWGVVPRLALVFHDLFGATENGRVRWYAASIAIGAVLVLTALLCM